MMLPITCCGAATKVGDPQKGRHTSSDYDFRAETSDGAVQRLHPALMDLVEDDTLVNGK